VCNQSFVFFPKERNTTAAAAFTCAKEETKEQIFKAGCSRDGMAAGRVLYNIGFWIRETGQALDRAGCRLQGNNIFKEPLTRHRPVINLYEKVPDVHQDAFVAPSAAVIGDVQIGAKSSVWYGCVLRGDVNSIIVGAETNIQDHSLVHVGTTSLSGDGSPTVIGDKVTIGHSAVLHACTVEDEAFVGMGATLLNGVVIEKGAFVAAGAVVSENTRIPAGQVWAGNPAKFLRQLKEEEAAFIPKSADSYAELASIHAKEHSKSVEELLGQSPSEESAAGVAVQ